MSNARRIELSTVYEGKNISGEINRYLSSFSYEDVASGASDVISIGVRDDERKWMGPWYPDQGDRIESKIAFVNWYEDNTRKSLFCGNFQVDDFSFKGRPLSANIGATAIPQNTAFNAEEKTKTWESITLQQLAQEIADRTGIALYYEADSICIQTIEQNEQTDCKFLYELCQAYGLAMKVHANRIVIYDEEWYELKPASIHLSETDMVSWSYNATIAGTYTGANFCYTDPNDDKEYAVEIGNSGRMLNINVTADSIQDAERKGIAKLNSENKKSTTMSVTIMANPSIVAGLNIQVNNLGNLSGKYYVDKVRTKVAGGSETQMTLSLRKITARIKNASIKAVEEAKEQKQAEGTQYTVLSGDTLWGIAKRFLSSGPRYNEIYEINKELIETTAKQHGKSNSKNGHWIWPGMVLTIPAA